MKGNKVRGRPGKVKDAIRLEERSGVSDRGEVGWGQRQGVRGRNVGVSGRQG